MEQYNYEAAMMDDVKEYINNEYSSELEEIKTIEELEEFTDKMRDELRTVDSVTGNASGSYTFNRLQAKEYVTGNSYKVRACIREFDNGDQMLNYYMDYNWEMIDVCIRCYLLSQVLEDWEIWFGEEKGL